YPGDRKILRSPATLRTRVPPGRSGARGTPGVIGASSGDGRYSVRYTLRSTASRADRSALTVHAGWVEPIFDAVLANDPSRIAAIEAGTPGAAAQRMEEDLFVADLPHQLYRGDTPLHLAASGLRYDAARAMLAAGTPVNAVNRRGATALHY